MFAIKQLLRGFASPADRARMAAVDLGLAVDRPCPDKAAEDAYLALALEECESDVTRMLHREYDTQFVAQSTLPGGRRKYAVLERSVSQLADASDDPDICEQMLDVFEEEWELNYRSPFASAFYGTMLSNTAFAWRGDATDADIIDPRWQKFQQYSQHAQDVFLETVPRPDQCPFWHRMFFMLGTVDGAKPSEQQARFERAVAFDAMETSLYAERMRQLLPGRGGSYAAMDAFALESVHATRSELGTAMYAKLYTHISAWEPLPLTQCNYNILRNSFFDWSRKNRSQYVINAMASAAFDFGDHDTVASMVAREWTEFHPAAWQSDERADDALSALARRHTPRARAA
jgi:hypothetical protein